ncbi:hypothetical protein AAEK85_000508 [Pseudomonas aeruginosa]
MNKANECTCPSGDGSLVHPCPAHPSVEQAGGDERAAFEAWSGDRFMQDTIHNRTVFGAGYRAALAKPSQAQAEQAEGSHVPDEVFAGVFAEWWEEEGQYCRAGGGDYERTFAFQAWRHLYPLLLQARAALAQPSPVRSSLLINGYQLRAALDFIAPDGTAEQLESEACIEWRQQDADFLEAGLYAFCAEYPEEGGVLLDEEPTTAQPSPLQSEQAEAERPEMSPERAAYFMRRFKSEEKLLGPNEQAAVDYVLSLLAQHDRIVGALRADRDSWAEQAEQRLADWDEMRKERDAALARVEQQERTIAGMNEAHAKLAGLYEAAQAQHSVPEEFIGRLSEFLAQRGATGKALLRELRDMLAAAPGNSAQHSVPELLEWAVGRWHAEVSLRPLINVHRRALDDTWRQVIRRLGGDTGLLCGPSHDELLAAAPAQGGE